MKEKMCPFTVVSRTQRRSWCSSVLSGAAWEMKVWPFGVALQEEASNRLMLRWLKTVVVSDEEKASWRRQVGTGKASES
jgi:hypothetical protein